MQHAVPASLLHPSIALLPHLRAWPFLKGAPCETDGNPAPPPTRLRGAGTGQGDTGSLAGLLPAALPAQRHADHVGTRFLCSM